MNTKLLKAKSPDDISAINEAGEILKNGGLVAIPTETVYGLAASAFNCESVHNVFKAKGRPGDNPLIVHISDISELEEITCNVSEKAKMCMKAFWPGPFTAIVEKTDKIPSAVSGGLNTVAVRMPSNDVARAIIHAAGVPLAAPSANISGSPSPTTAKHVINDLFGKIDAIVVSNDCSVGVESTVVSFCGEAPKLLRPGGITPEQLRKIVPDLIIDPAVTEKINPNAVVSSPGMKYRHYAPNSDVTMVIGSSEKFCEFCNKNKEKFELAICYDQDAKNTVLNTLSLGDVKDHAAQAERLFSALRTVDEMKIKTVVVHAPSTDGIGLAVYNRLIRAAGFKVIKL